jgi:(2R)-ethylmalonyl-CoA mutase
MQQIVAFETDLLDFGDIFDGSKEIERKVEELKKEAREELARIEEMGGAVAAVESSYMKQKLVESNTKRLEAIERGEQTVVGVNRFTETEPSPLTTGEGAILTVPEHVEKEQVERLKAWRNARDQKKVASALEALRRAASEGTNIMPASIEAAKAGVTTGEWGGTLREVFGEYRAPTGVGRSARASAEGLDEVRGAVEKVSKKLGRRLKFLVGKPGLDGHSNGAEQIAVRARDAGMEVVYEGIRLTPAEIVNAALEEGVHVVGLSILSGSHVPLVRDVMSRMRSEGMEIPVIVGGIIPPEDENVLKQCGVAAVYTPKNYELNRILSDIVRVVDDRATKAA